MSEIAGLLRDALGAYQAGRYDETEEICNRVLLLKRNEVNACHMLGMVAMKRGDSEDAVSLLDRAASQETANPEIQHNHAQALKMAGRLREAVDAFRRAIKLVPESPALYTNLANVQRELGKFDDARENYLAALKYAPDQAEIHANLGDLLRITRDMNGAEYHCRRALELSPNLTFALVNLGAVLRERGRIREALEPLSRASELDQTNLWAWQQLGEVAADLGQARLAEQALRHVLDRDPSNISAAFRLGEVLGHSGRYPEALDMLTTVIDRDPTHLEAYVALGKAKDKLGYHDEALVCFQEAAKLDPDHLAALKALGESFAEEGRTEEAEAILQRAYSRAPDGVGMIRLATLLPVVATSSDSLNRHRAAFETTLAKLSLSELKIEDPLRDGATVPFRLAFQGLDDRSARETLAGIYRAACPELLFSAPHVAVGPRKHQGRWRIGVYGGGLDLDSVGELTIDLIGALNQDEFELIGLLPPGQSDEMERAFEDAVTHVLNIPEDLFKARTLISRLELDALYYPALGRDDLSYFLGFARLAPVQIQGTGYPVTSGLSTIDYVLSGEDWEPVGGERHYTEKLVRLNAQMSWYEPPETALSWRTRDDLGLDEDRNIYLCPAPIDQLHPDFDAVLAEILRLDPMGEILLVAPERALWDELWGRRFSQNHPDVAARIRFAMQPSRGDLLNMMVECNVMLDPSHYSADNLALDAFALGTPVITQPGNHARNRRTYAHYRRMSILDCVVYDPGDYVETAVTIATDRRRQATIQQAILKRSDILFRDQATVSAVEKFLQNTLANWGRQDLPGE